MALRALRFAAGTRGDGPARCRIDTTTVDTFSGATAHPRPAAYLLTNDDLAELARSEALRSVVLDRGRKHPGKGLAAVLLGHPRVPLVRGSYRDAGQLRRSMRTLLDHASVRGERQVYLVGTDVDLFDVLWARAPSQIAAGVPRTRSDDTRDAETGALEILSLLDTIEVPVALEHRYVGDAPNVQLVRKLIVRAAKADEPVLILGETGTGKEVVARSIHDFGRRRGPFIVVNCGAIPGELLESELFGHVAGAFTHARQRRIGLWQLAHGGTIFLDEFGDLRPEHQAKILRALEEGSIRPVGAERETHADARVIAATNRDLYAMVRAGEFRDDLYFRVRSFLIRTPGVHEHPDDVPLLADHFWRKLTADPTASLSAALLDELRRTAWPGNARELRSALSHLRALFPDSDPTPEHFRAGLRFNRYALGPAATPRGTGRVARLRTRDRLLRLEEVVRACRATLEPLGRRRLDDAAIRRVDIALRRRLDELRLVLTDGAEDPRFARAIPRRALDAMGHLRRRLVDLAVAVELGPDAARRVWRRGAKSEIDAALAVIERAIVAMDAA